MWSPELVVDEELARSLVGGRLPHLRGAPMRLLGEGWDSTVWLAGEEWVFRFPRREVVVPGFLREIEVLRRLAPALPLSCRWPSVAGSRTSASAGRGPASGSCPGVRIAWAVTSNPAPCAASTTARSSSMVNWGTNASVPDVLTPPLAMIFTMSTPRSARCCTARHNSSTPRAWPPMFQQWPPGLVIGGPEASTVGIPVSPRLRSRQSITASFGPRGPAPSSPRKRGGHAANPR